MIKAINDLARHVEPLRAELDAAVARVLRSGWFVLGPEVAAFESGFAAYCGVPHCVSVGNGTDALELALRALGIGPGGRVATVANAGAYSTLAIRASGAQVVFADIDRDTLLMDLSSLRGRMSSERVDAVVATHLFGRMLDMAEVAALCRASGVALIEDCAQAHGATQQGARAGSFGDVGCFSFYPTKNLGALGDGGAVVARDMAVAARLRQLRQYGWSQKYASELAGGRNSRLDELQAALLSVQLPHLDGWNAQRRRVAQQYSSLIRHPDVRCPTAQAMAGVDHVGHLYVVRTARRDELQRHLKACGVPHDIHYPIPDHRQASLEGWVPMCSLPVTEEASRTVLTLPCFPEMTDAEVAEVAGCVNAW